MDGRHESRRSWPRLTLTISPDARDQLHELARANFRDPRREALRLLLDALERERLPLEGGGSRDGAA